MPKTFLTILCIAISGAGFLWTASTAVKAANWNGAENYASLALLLIGVPIAIVQAVSAFVVILCSREFTPPLKAAVRWGAGSLVVLTVLAILSR